ncbi:unannotated protein [freshwater metagenome]|jgi:hypothetical protein|uniref:Unannotated protein n=1 Tax=freshwater metagenome TaxID=449393 RepID=A0A6J7MKJ3_9ZZZZ|nr:hypothetical protein [Actinomycetota bacterium]MSV94742.1 hypothetical protein [Actinomycetota bacterium]MSY45283.1 hypothetical protein [Actinomycetota bacterium]
MRKTLAVVVVFGVALLVASPAQAKPVKQRAANAALCYETYRVTFGSSDRTESEIQGLLELTPNKCLAIINRHVGWLKAQYPSQWEAGVLSERARRAASNNLLGRFERAYGVTPTQIINAPGFVPYD